MKANVNKILLANIKRLKKKGATADFIESYKRGFINTFDTQLRKG